METLIMVVIGITLGGGVPLITGYQIVSWKWWAICIPANVVLAIIVHLVRGV